MGFTAEEIADGVGRMLERLNADGVKAPSRNGARFRALDGVTIDVEPMPEERIRYPALLPRTLVTLRGDPIAVERLRREILLAFLRVGG
jgi:hypothetical protein